MINNTNFMITGLHHVNFVVADLDAAVERFGVLLDQAKFEFDSLPARAVNTAKTKIGGTWLVLVQPIDDQSVPARYLREHGEGFFLMSLETDDLDAQIKAYQANHLFRASAQRTGLDGWQVTDLDPNYFFGTQIQLTQDDSSTTHRSQD